MSTVPLSHPGAGSRAPGVDRLRSSAQRAPAALAAALLLLLLYAGFSHGAVALATEARMQVAIAAIVAIAGIALLWSGTLTLATSRGAIAGLGLLAAFVIWSAVTVLWSVAPNPTWIEFNRGLTYVLVLGLAMVLGSSLRRAPERIADGFLLIALAMTAYALGQKLLPGLHVSGVFDLNQTGSFPRLQEPLGYWNALALFIAYGTPIALARAADRDRSRRARSAALVAVPLMLLTIGLTYSRGGLIALVVGLAAGIALSGARLRLIMWLGAAVLAALPPLIFGLTNHALSSANVSLGSREGPGLILLVVVLLSSGALLAGGQRLRDVEERTHVGPERARRIGRLLLGLVGVVAVIALLGVTFSSRGLTGTVSHAWKSFTATRVTSTNDSQRLLSASSENRWVWWKEAAGAFSDRPIAGWGAGSFGVVHLLYRRDRLSVNQPHSVPLQFLSETGLIGTVLATLGFGLLLRAATRRVREGPPGRERLLTSALFAAVVMFAVHSLYDWDWDIPAMTLPAMAFLGVLCGSARRQRATGPGFIVRGLALAALTIFACTFAISAALPSLAQSKAAHALVEAAGSPADVQRAQATAELASRLDPLSDAGLLVEATIAARRGQLQKLRDLLITATHRNPTDISAWFQLAFAELRLGDKRAVAQAGQRAAALNPAGSLPPSVASTPSRRRGPVSAPPRPPPTAQPLPSG